MRRTGNRIKLDEHVDVLEMEHEFDLNGETQRFLCYQLVVSGNIEPELYDSIGDAENEIQRRVKHLRQPR